jgi:hypothetical protein
MAPEDDLFGEGVLTLMTANSKLINVKKIFRELQCSWIMAINYSHLRLKTEVDIEEVTAILKRINQEAGRARFYRVMNDEGTCHSLIPISRPASSNKQPDSGPSESKLIRQIRISNVAGTFPQALTDNLVATVCQEAEKVKLFAEGQSLTVSFHTCNQESISLARQKPLRIYAGFRFSLQVLDVAEHDVRASAFSGQPIDSIVARLNPRRAAVDDGVEAADAMAIDSDGKDRQ